MKCGSNELRAPGRVAPGARGGWGLGGEEAEGSPFRGIDNQAGLLRRAGMASLVLLVSLLVGLQPADAQPLPVDPIPVAPIATTNEGFPNFNFDHRYIHSGTHLQGVRAPVKWAGGLIHRPAPGTTNFDRMTGAVIVDNPDPLLPMTATITYFDALGVQVGQTVTVIPPEGHYIEPATPLATTFGVGTARVTVNLDESPPLLGATLQHTPQFQVPLGGAPVVVVDGDRPLSTNGQVPGASSMQQLQKPQESTQLFWHYPLSLLSPVDFYNGNLPWLHVVNPNNAANTVALTLTVFDNTTQTVLGTFPWRTVALPPNGTLTEISGPHLPALGTFNVGLFEAMAGLYLSVNPLDWDVLVQATSLTGLPILGDGYHADVLGPATDDGNAIRMASSMMSSTPQANLITPELSYDRVAAGGIIQTLVGIFNPGPGNAGPLTIQYFDNFGGPLAQFQVPTLPAGQSLRIQPGALGYPALPVTQGFGWARVVASAPVVGWAVREVLPATAQTPPVEVQRYHKAYGEALLNLNGAEPGPGFQVPGTNLTRKVAPWVWVDSTVPTFPWPGYTTFGNFSVPNIGPYSWQFYNQPGALCGFTPLAGLPFGVTSWTYEDPLTFCGGPINLSGRVDHTFGRIEGLDVIGDPMDEYRNILPILQDFALPQGGPPGEPPPDLQPSGPADNP